MLKKCIFLLFVFIGVFASDTAFAKKAKGNKHAVHSSKGSTSTTAIKRVKHTVKGHGKKKSHLPVDIKSETVVTTDTNGAKVISNSKQMIANNNEKNRIADSTHKATFQNNLKEDKEGYFASMFASKTKATTFQTIEGTAAIFKSMSGWDDKKFYVLTNLLPIGTIVRITTPDLKSICAKVINALPEMGNSVQYRLNDAAASILGISNKTFPVSVTY
jgi:hypothetical protein